MFLLYNVLLTLLAPVWAPWMLVRANRRGEAPNWRERTGDYEIEPRKDGKRVWLHAVSVGEVLAAKPILRELRKLLPEHEIVLSVTTSSGHRTAREQATDLYDHLVYFPIDVARFQLAAMQRVQPAVVAIMETELWMNFLWAAKVFDARTLLINGRISDRSFSRARRVKALYSAMLKNVDRCLMQTQRDAERIQSLGAREAEVFGNVKFDQALQGVSNDSERWRKELGLPNLPVVVIGSTRGEVEEKFVLEALRQVGPEEVAVVWAPRHLERVPALVATLRHAGLNPQLRSEGGTGSLIVLDTYGELDQVYAAADIAVIGGGFDNLGGQNLIQPLAHGKPVVHGPHMQNFRDAAESAKAAGATIIAEKPDQLAQAIRELIASPSRRAQMGGAATELVKTGAGAAERYAQAIADAATET